MEFLEFIATKKYCNNLPETLGIDEDCCSRTGFIYDDCYYIEIDEEQPDSFILVLDREFFKSNDIEKLEKFLFDYFKEYLEA